MKVQLISNQTSGLGLGLTTIWPLGLKLLVSASKFNSI